MKSAPPPKLIVFTDLDDTLLDRDYAFDAAKPALDRLARHEIPVIIVTSKTAAETEDYRQRLGLDWPYAVELGGALIWPASAAEPRQVETYGLDYAGVREKLGALRTLSGLPLTGFGDMSDDDLMLVSGLNAREAALARRREYTEPFRVESGNTPDAEAKLTAVAAKLGMRVTRGGRFFTLHDRHDKGTAVRRLIEWARSRYGPVRTVGLGDAPIDLAMLAETDVAYALPRHDGGYINTGRTPATLMQLPGAAGWNVAIHSFLDANGVDA